MKALLLRYAERIDAMTLRERLILFAAAAVMLVVFVYSLWIDPEFAKSRRLGNEIAQRQAEMKALQDQVAKLGKMREADPDRQSRERLAKARDQLAAVQGRIAAEERKFTAPDKMRQVVEGLLARNKRVRMVALTTLPVASISELRSAPGVAAKPGGAERLIFRHGMELTVAGAYLDLLAYLTDLERLPTQLYWSALAMEGRSPAVSLKITIYTLSLDRAWLNV